MAGGPSHVGRLLLLGYTHPKGSKYSLRSWLNPTNCFRKYSLIGQVTVAFHCKCYLFYLTPDLGVPGMISLRCSTLTCNANHWLWPYLVINITLLPWTKSKLSFWDVAQMDRFQCFGHTNFPIEVVWRVSKRCRRWFFLPSLSLSTLGFRKDVLGTLSCFLFSFKRRFFHQGFAYKVEFWARIFSRIRTTESKIRPCFEVTGPIPGLSTYPIWEAREPVDRYGQVNWALLVFFLGSKRYTSKLESWEARNILFQHDMISHDGSMVLLYMVCQCVPWIPSIYPLYVSIYI